MSDDRQPSVRLFLALWPPAKVRAALQDLQSRWQWPDGAARVPPERLHVTLHFLGQVPVSRVREFRDAFDVPVEPHVIELSRSRHAKWPGGLAVLELDPPPALLRLHEGLATALRRLGWPVEARAFRPHVTFSRKAAGARPPAEPMGDVPAWRVNEGHVLARSVPSQGYEVLHAYGLR